MGILEGKKLLVTGVLMDSSIAFHVAKIAQEEGAQVVLTSFGRTMKITQTIARRLPETPPVIELDVAEQDHLDTLADRLRGILREIGHHEHHPLAVALTDRDIEPGHGAPPAATRGTLARATVATDALWAGSSDGAGPHRLCGGP